jgi:hypothetical protein
VSCTEGTVGREALTEWRGVKLIDLDENLVFIREDGFQTTYFALDCRSLAEDGSSIDGATTSALPVGGGHTLECTLERFPNRATTDVLSAANEPWCALGELQSYRSGGDDRLTISIATEPDVAPAILTARHPGEEILVAQAAAFGGRLWPLWIEASYDVVELARAQPGKICDQIFEL